MSEYWLISAPGDKTCQQTFETMNNITSKQHSLCANFKFHIPDLKVGTLDQLVGLSDDLGKLDAYVEASTRKVAQYLGEVLEDQRDKLHENLLANNSSEPQEDVNLKDDTGGGDTNKLRTLPDNQLLQKTKSLPHCGCVELLCRQCYEMGREMHFLTMLANKDNLNDNNNFNERNLTLINNCNSNRNLKNNLIINIHNNNINSINDNTMSKDKTTPTTSTPTGTSSFDWWFHKNKKHRNSISKIELRRHSATATITTNCKSNDNYSKSLSATSSSSSSTGSSSCGNNSTGNNCGVALSSPTTVTTTTTDANFNFMRKNRSKSLAINRTLHPRLPAIGSCCIKTEDAISSIPSLEVLKIDNASNHPVISSPTSCCIDEANNCDMQINNAFIFPTPLQSPVNDNINIEECFNEKESATSPLTDTNTTNNTCNQQQMPLSPGDLPSYITRFQWDMAKYPIKQSLRNIADIISKQVGQIDADLKTKSAAYNNLKGNLQNLEKKQTGSLLTRNLADLVKKEHFILDSEYLTTLLVIVPKAIAGDWNTGYERITDMIVPRSSQLITQDQDFALYSVTLFKKVVDEFKLHAREKKFVVRDFVYNEEELAAGKNEITKLVTDKKKQFGPLVRWLKVNFSECFCAWVHVKALRVFVESVLRYGLPVNFQAILIQPHKKSTKRLRDVLQQLYGHLDGSGSSNANHAADTVDIPGLGFGQAEYFPYVCYKLSIDMVETKI